MATHGFPQQHRRLAFVMRSRFQPFTRAQYDALLTILRTYRDLFPKPHSTSKDDIESDDTSIVVLLMIRDIAELRYHYVGANDENTPLDPKRLRHHPCLNPLTATGSQRHVEKSVWQFFENDVKTKRIELFEEAEINGTSQYTAPRDIPYNKVILDCGLRADVLRYILSNNVVARVCPVKFETLTQLISCPTKRGATARRTLMPRNLINLHAPSPKKAPAGFSRAVVESLSLSALDAVAEFDPISDDLATFDPVWYFPLFDQEDADDAISILEATHQMPRTTRADSPCVLFGVFNNRLIDDVKIPGTRSAELGLFLGFALDLARRQDEHKYDELVHRIANRRTDTANNIKRAIAALVNNQLYDDSALPSELSVTEYGWGQDPPVIESIAHDGYKKFEALSTVDDIGNLVLDLKAHEARSSAHRRSRFVWIQHKGTGTPLISLAKLQDTVGRDFVVGDASDAAADQLAATVESFKPIAEDIVSALNARTADAAMGIDDRSTWRELKLILEFLVDWPNDRWATAPEQARDAIVFVGSILQGNTASAKERLIEAKQERKHEYDLAISSLTSYFKG